jgi:hypothetical protein
MPSATVLKAYVQIAQFALNGQRTSPTHVSVP